jgi:hypothetical protein
MAQRTTLTEQQVEILRWIAAGCPTGVMEGSFHRISAAALRRRGLVKVSGKGATWSAGITKAGTEYLDQADGANPPAPPQANVPVTQQLIDDIATAGGVLRVPRRGWYDRSGIDYEQRARLAERHGKVPAGKWLTIRAHRDEVELRLEDMPPGVAEPSAELTPVAVPEAITRHHPAARRFRGRKAEHQVPQAALPRATRIVHAIALEAQRRGWKPQPAIAGVKVSPPGIEVVLTLKERGVQRRGPWEEEVKRYRNYKPLFRERPVPEGPYDQHASGELELAMSVTPPSGLDGRQSRGCAR